MGLFFSPVFFFFPPQLVSGFPLGGNRGFNQKAGWESVLCKGHMKGMDCLQEERGFAIALLLYVNLRVSSLSLNSNSQNGWLSKPQLHLQVNAANINLTRFAESGNDRGRIFGICLQGKNLAQNRYLEQKQNYLCDFKYFFLHSIHIYKVFQAPGAISWCSICAFVEQM